MNAAITRLLELRQENDRLTHPNGDPDRIRWTARQCAGHVSIRHGRTERLRIIGGKVYRPRGAEWVLWSRSTAEYIRRMEEANVKARAAGHVEWEERQRLDALCAKHWTGGLLPPCWWEMSHLARTGTSLRFRTPKTAQDRREVGELRRRLKVLA